MKCLINLFRKRRDSDKNDQDEQTAEPKSVATDTPETMEGNARNQTRLDIKERSAHQVENDRESLQPLEQSKDEACSHGNQDPAQADHGNCQADRIADDSSQGRPVTPAQGIEQPVLSIGDEPQDQGREQSLSDAETADSAETMQSPTSELLPESEEPKNETEEQTGSLEWADPKQEARPPEEMLQESQSEIDRLKKDYEVIISEYKSRLEELEALLAELADRTVQQQAELDQLKQKINQLNLDKQRLMSQNALIDSFLPSIRKELNLAAEVHFDEQVAKARFLTLKGYVSSVSRLLERYLDQRGE